MDFRTLNDSDGTIINTSEAYEAVVIETLRSWLSGMGKAFFSVGPTVPVDFKSGELVKSQKVPNGGSATEIEHSAEQSEVELFLENALDKYGKESVIFVRYPWCKFSKRKTHVRGRFFQISFGSTYWPPDNSFVEEILNVMIEKDFPFVRSAFIMFLWLSTHDIGILSSIIDLCVWIPCRQASRKP
jgi:hypothetical protein